METKIIRKTANGTQLVYNNPQILEQTDSYIKFKDLKTGTVIRLPNADYQLETRRGN